MYSFNLSCLDFLKNGFNDISKFLLGSFVFIVAKIVKFEGAYHGAHDYCLVKGGSGAACLPDSLGIPVDSLPKIK